MAQKKKTGFSISLAIIRKYGMEARAIEDSNRDIYIEVDGRVLRGSKPTPDACPLARACSSALDLDGALVSRGVVYLVKNGIATRYVPSSTATRMLNQFDKTGKFIPGVYKLLAPRPAQTLARQRAYGVENSHKTEGGVGRGKRPYMKRTYHVNGLRGRLHV